MERTCPSCGAEPGAGSFCQHCGTRLAGDEAPATDQPSAAAPPPESEAAPAPAPATPPSGEQIPAKRSGCRSGCLIIGVIALAAVGLGGFLGWQYVSEEILPRVQDALPGIQATADEFATLSETPAGPCYDIETEDDVLTGWTEVSCSGPRQVEVSFAATFEPGPWPGDDYLAETAADTCTSAFERYVGSTPDESDYGVEWLLPTEAMWADGSRQGICLVVSDDGSALTGTIKGSET